ncbi:MAG: FKBP-type peptidyl-prolyl cis-trans isomerase [Bacteroidetes bacterium]|nr:FKBP-type peptidyl-prolyl cis-trans isomerase [Bacteroidota bacterium]
MRILFIIFFLSVYVSTYSQSKKELQQKITTQQEQIKKLQTEIDELKKPKEPDLSTDKQKAGYGMGVLLSNNIRKQGGDSLDVSAMLAAIQDVYNGKPLKMEQQQCMTTVQQYMSQASEKKNVRAREAGKIFLENNKKNEGVVELPSGLQYKIVTKGSGKSPDATANVTVHYTGQLTDGVIFESSIQRGQPISLGVNQVIPGWTEALQLMKEGDRWMLYIPYNLAYGERGSGSIPPFAVLIFELELIKVN